MGGRSGLKCGNNEVSWVMRTECTCGSMQMESSQGPLDHRLLECGGRGRAIGYPGGETLYMKLNSESKY